MDIKLRTYARLLEHGTITLEQVPDEYKELVQAYDPEQDKPEEEEPMPEIFGAPTLGSIHKQYTGAAIDVFTEEIFTEGTLNGNPAPLDMNYAILRVENVYGRFIDQVSVSVSKTNYGFTLNIEGTPLDIVNHENILRVDLIISSINYEDMTLTVYIVS